MPIRDEGGSRHAGHGTVEARPLVKGANDEDAHNPGDG